MDKLKAAGKAASTQQNATGFIIGGENKGCCITGKIASALNDKNKKASFGDKLLGIDKEFREAPDTLEVATLLGEVKATLTSGDIKSYKVIATTHTSMFIKINLNSGATLTVQVATMTIVNSSNGKTTTTTTVYLHDADDILSVLAPCDLEK